MNEQSPDPPYGGPGATPPPHGPPDYGPPTCGPPLYGPPIGEFPPLDAVLILSDKVRDPYGRPLRDAL